MDTVHDSGLGGKTQGGQSSLRGGKASALPSRPKPNFSSAAFESDEPGIEELQGSFTAKKATSNLCSLCLKLRPPHYDENGRPNVEHKCIWRHHASFEALIASANAGCPLCNLFRPFVENVVKRRKVELDDWNESQKRESQEEKSDEQSFSESKLNQSQDSGSIQANQLPSSPSYASYWPQNGSLEDPFESDYDKQTSNGTHQLSLPSSVHYEVEGNDAYYYTDEVRENYYGEQGDERYYIITNEADDDDEAESKFTVEVERVDKIIAKEDEEEESYWKQWTEPGPKPWDSSDLAENDLPRFPSPRPTFESTSTARNPILQWILNMKGTITGSEQLWVTAFFYEEENMPNKRQNLMSAALRLTAGSVYDESVAAETFCCDGDSIPNLHVLAMTFPGLWKWKYDALQIKRRKPLKTRTPLFEFFQLRDSAQHQHTAVLARDIPSDPNSQRCFATAKGWLDICLKNHSQCRNKTLKLFPTRLLDVSTQNRPGLKLVYGSRLSPTEEYIALSHCWGKDVSDLTKLESKSLAKWETAIDEDSLSLNFRDAITITRGLGVNYLWIDALCIKQDDKDDWVKESSKMGLYYRHALLVVSALSSPGAKYGILHKRLADADAVQTPHIGRSVALRPLLPDTTFVMDNETFSDLRKQPSSLPLKARAWSMQERLFARRLLHYTTDQMIWQCKTCLFGEDGQFADLDPTKPVTQGANNDLVVIKPGRVTEANPRGLISVLSTGWFEMLKYYTARHMTFPSDLLPGISSLAQEIAAATGCAYYAGIWWGARRTRLVSLLWESRDGYERTGPSTRRAHLLPGEIDIRPAYYEGSSNVPSWSWSSLTLRLAAGYESSVEDGSTAIEHPGIDAEFGVPVVRPLSAADRFGAVLAGGYIPTRGFLFPYIGEDTFQKKLLPAADVFQWGDKQRQFANFDVPSRWEVPLENDDYDSDSDAIGSKDELVGKRHEDGIRKAYKGSEYANENLFLLYVCSFNEFADTKSKKFEWQIFLLLQRSYKEEEELDWSTFEFQRKTKEIYKRVGLASTPSGTRLRIGADGWEKKRFEFH